MLRGGGTAGLPASRRGPALKTTATVGRTDLTGTGGKVVEVTELVSRTDRDLVMAKLAQPVTDIAPLPLADSAPVAGESLRALGYGRTATSWVPDRLHAGTVAVTASDATTVAVTRDGGAICKGDAGGPALREQDGKVLLAAVHSASWQAGCFGTDETRPGAVETRTDDIVDWVTQVRGLPKDPQVASGDFNGDGRRTSPPSTTTAPPSTASAGPRSSPSTATAPASPSPRGSGPAPVPSTAQRSS